MKMDLSSWLRTACGIISATKWYVRSDTLTISQAGFWYRLTEPHLCHTFFQAVNLVAQQRDARQAAQVLVKAARKMWTSEGRGYIDDVTALVLTLP